MRGHRKVGQECTSLGPRWVTAGQLHAPVELTAPARHPFLGSLPGLPYLFPSVRLEVVLPPTVASPGAPHSPMLVSLNSPGWTVLSVSYEVGLCCPLVRQGT